MPTTRTTYRNGKRSAERPGITLGSGKGKKGSPLGDRRSPEEVQRLASHQRKVASVPDTLWLWTTTDAFT